MALSVWTRVQGLVFGGAVASAFSRAVEPILEPVRQRAWSRNPVRVLGVDTLADLIARGLVSAANVVDDAKRSGHPRANLEALAALKQSFPDLGTLDKLSNRKLIGPDAPAPAQDLLALALARHGIPPEYHGPLVELFNDVLSPGELAAAIHRGLVPDPVGPNGKGMLLGEQPGPDRNVQAYPVRDIDAVREAAASGYDFDRLAVLVGLQGLPMGVIEAAQAYFRGVITHSDYIAAFNESNSRNEWAEAVLAYARQIPTARDFLENALRGHHSLEWAQEQAARHGMSPEDAEIIWQNQGRAMSLTSITRGLAWGAPYEPAPTDKPDPYEQSTLVGPLRPEFYKLNEALKYTLPSALYFRTLQQQKVLTPEQAETWYTRLGWPPELAHQVAQAYATVRSTAAKEATVADLLTLFEGDRIDEPAALAAIEALGYDADAAQLKLDTLGARRVIAEKSRAVTALHKAYIGQQTDAERARASLASLGIPAWAVQQMLTTWIAELEGTIPTGTPTP